MQPSALCECCGQNHDKHNRQVVLSVINQIRNLGFFFLFWESKQATHRWPTKKKVHCLWMRRLASTQLSVERTLSAKTVWFKSIRHWDRVYCCDRDLLLLYRLSAWPRMSWTGRWCYVLVYFSTRKSKTWLCANAATMETMCCYARTFLISTQHMKNNRK